MPMVGGKMFSSIAAAKKAAKKSGKKMVMTMPKAMYGRKAKMKGSLGSAIAGMASGGKRGAAARKKARTAGARAKARIAGARKQSRTASARKASSQKRMARIRRARTY